MVEPTQSKAIIWSALERFSSQGIAFLISIILARLLDPSCYGLVAMLNIFLAIGQSIIDSGFTSALIRKKKCTDVDYSTVFIFNLLLSTILYILFFFSSTFIASFYNQPELETITRFSTFVFIINALAIVQRAQLSKKMDFKSQTKASVIAVLVSGIVGIVMAYKGYGVWALVTQSLLSAFVSTFVLWCISLWFPKLNFSWDSFREMYAFGSRLFLTGLITTIYKNIYTLIIGKFYNSTDLGYFNRMDHLAAFPSRNFTTIVGRAVYPKQCKYQDDKEKLYRSYLDLLSLSSFFVFPVMLMLAALSEPLVLSLLGEKWVAASQYLMLLCLAYMMDHIQFFNWQMLSVKGRSDLSLYSEIIKKIVSVLILVITIPFGIKVMIIGLSVYALADFLIIIPFVHKVLPSITYWSEIKVLYKSFLNSVLCFAVVKTIIPFFHNCWIQLIVSGICGIILYCAMAKMLKSWELSYYSNKIINVFKR